jgi:hypothetical protein
MADGSKFFPKAFNVREEDIKDDEDVEPVEEQRSRKKVIMKNLVNPFDFKLSDDDEDDEIAHRHSYASDDDGSEYGTESDINKRKKKRQEIEKVKVISERKIISANIVTNTDINKVFFSKQNCPSRSILINDTYEVVFIRSKNTLIIIFILLYKFLFVLTAAHW